MNKIGLLIDYSPNEKKAVQIVDRFTTSTASVWSLPVLWHILPISGQAAELQKSLNSPLEAIAKQPHVSEMASHHVGVGKCLVAERMALHPIQPIGLMGSPIHLGFFYLGKANY